MANPAPSWHAGGESRDVKHFSPDMWGQNESRQGKVAELAGRQHGVVAHRQLIALGFGQTTIDRWVARGWLHRLYRAVYAVGHTTLSTRGRWLAGVLACGRGAVLSHQPAAALLDLRRSASRIIHVTTPGRASPRGLSVHRVRHLHPEDCTLVDRIPVTTVARTFLDVAEVLPSRQVVRVLEQAERIGAFDLAAVRSVLARNPGRRGAKPLKQAIEAFTGYAPFVNSDWERDLLDFCDDHGIPRPELNVLVGGFLVDALWRDAKVIVELDSWSHHRSRRAFEQDRERVCVLQLAGYTVLPMTRLDARAARLITAAAGAR